MDVDKNLKNKAKDVSKTLKANKTKSSDDKDLQKIPKEILIQMHDNMVQSRVTEERMIKIYKMGDAYFWIGGPGEEAFGVPLGMLVNKGQGHDHDWLHLHYRCTPTLMAMGMPMIDAIRLIMNKATDENTGGRNFSNHYCYPEWNVAPVSSPIEIQYGIAIGTAWAQRRNKAKGITIVSGGDAGTAEGEFASSLIWSSRKNNELPMLITVQNNRWGISTSYNESHGEESIADRGKAFGIRTALINGNDPVESYIRLKEEMTYIRQTGKPVVLEAEVSRLYGHSSASGANFAKNETDCNLEFENRLISAGIITEKSAKELFDKYNKQSQQIQEQVRGEADPNPESIWDHVYVNNENGDWRKF